MHALLFCQDHRVCELSKHFSFLFTPFLRTFQLPNPFCCNRSTTILLIISFLSRTLDFPSFFLSLWINLWLAETSQQPISQTTWLKVTPHCNQCNHWGLLLDGGMREKEIKSLCCLSTLAWTFPATSAAHFLAFASLATAFRSKECIMTGIKCLISSGSVTV